MKKNIILFLKGILMGICDIIPGISGGTIAFITGIYPKLINAVKNISPKLFINFFKMLAGFNKKDIDCFKKSFAKINILFLIVLGSGIITSFLLMSKIIKFLLADYFSYTMSFFIGLILASSIMIYKEIKDHKFKSKVFGLLGLLFGIMLAFIIPAKINPNLVYIFIGGFLAISAMFLPGISGSFILVILGLYEFMLGVLHNISSNLNYFFIFCFGAALGAFSISRIVSYLFSKAKCLTLYFLLGLVLGALSIPINKIYIHINSGSEVNLFFLFGLVAFGILVVIGIEKIAKK